MAQFFFARTEEVVLCTIIIVLIINIILYHHIGYRGLLLLLEHGRSGSRAKVKLVAGSASTTHGSSSTRNM
jgi:hypothetical protein